MRSFLLKGNFKSWKKRLLPEMHRYQYRDRRITKNKVDRKT